MGRLRSVPPAFLRVHWQVQQVLPSPRVGFCLWFCLRSAMGRPTDSLEQTCASVGILLLFVFEILKISIGQHASEKCLCMLNIFGFAAIYWEKWLSAICRVSLHYCEHFTIAQHYEYEFTDSIQRIPSKFENEMWLKVSLSHQKRSRKKLKVTLNQGCPLYLCIRMFLGTFCLNEKLSKGFVPVTFWLAQPRISFPSPTLATAESFIFDTAKTSRQPLKLCHDTAEDRRRTTESKDTAMCLLLSVDDWPSVLCVSLSCNTV